MIESLHHRTSKFVTARAAAERVGYSSDYVSRLAREGKVRAKREGRNWEVDLDSVKLFTLEIEAEKRRRQETLKQERRQERILSSYSRPVASSVIAFSSRRNAWMESVVVFVCLLFFVFLGTVAVRSEVGSDGLLAGVQDVQSDFQQAFVFSGISDFGNWLWLIRNEQVAVVGVGGASELSVTVETNSNVSIRKAPQVANNQEVNILEPADGEIDSEYIAEVFSDEVIVEFVTQRQGTVTPQFRSTVLEKYPFRLVKAPVTVNE